LNKAFKEAVHPPSTTHPRAYLVAKAQARRPHGTQSCLLTAASFRTWRGSQVFATWDPTFNTMTTI